MGWADESVDSLTLPNTAGPNNSRILIGSDIPAELRTTTIDPGFPAPPVAVIIMFNASGDYGFQALYANGLQNAEIRGFVVQGTVYAAHFEKWGPPSNHFIDIGYDPSVLVEFPHGFTVVGVGPTGVRHKGINNAAAVDSTTSGAYANLAGTSSFNFTKDVDASQIRIDLHATWFASTTTTGAKFGVRINGVDYDVAVLNSTVSAGVHMQTSGVAYVASGLAAGTYTVQGRWLRSSGTGTAQRDGTDWISISAAEVAS